MRRLFSMLLMAVFLLPSLAPLLALAHSDESSLPACCRRDGKHHCMLGMSQRDGVAHTAGTVLQAPPEPCPYCPPSVAPTHPDPLVALATAEAVFAGVVSHPTVAPQTECKRRMALDRARGKRGPPGVTLLS